MLQASIAVYIIHLLLDAGPWCNGKCPAPKQYVMGSSLRKSLSKIGLRLCTNFQIPLPVRRSMSDPA